MAKKNPPSKATGSARNDMPPVRPHAEIEEQLTRGERRRKKDWITRAVPAFSLISWAATIVMLVFLERARPQQRTFLDTVLDAPLRTTWNTSLLRMCLALLIAVFFVCVLGFILNASRQRRKTDKFNKSIIIMGILSLFGIAIFLWRFWSML